MLGMPYMPAFDHLQTYRSTDLIKSVRGGFLVTHAKAAFTDGKPEAKPSLSLTKVRFGLAKWFWVICRV
jgi:hypothetical protein